MLIAHELGGSDLERRLEALIDDRGSGRPGPQGRQSWKQAGVRFARRFVLLVPVGMALAGMSVLGNSRRCLSNGGGHVVVVGVGVVVACWVGLDG